MAEESLEGKSHRKKHRKSSMQFDEITLSELIGISNKPFLVEGMVLSTTRTHIQKLTEGCNGIPSVQDFPVLPDEDIQ